MRVMKGRGILNKAGLIPYLVEKLIEMSTQLVL